MYGWANLEILEIERQLPEVQEEGIVLVIVGDHLRVRMRIVT